MSEIENDPGNVRPPEEEEPEEEGESARPEEAENVRPNE